MRDVVVSILFIVIVLLIVRILWLENERPKRQRLRKPSWPYWF